jgi:hypothetical protein
MLSLCVFSQRKCNNTTIMCKYFVLTEQVFSLMFPAFQASWMYGGRLKSMKIEYTDIEGHFHQRSSPSYAGQIQDPLN